VRARIEELLQEGSGMAPRKMRIIILLASSLIRVTFTLSSATPHTTRKKISGSAGGSRLR
jgi:hypothetical protein